MPNIGNANTSAHLSQELQEIKEMKEWAGANNQLVKRGHRTFRSSELGGHMALKKRNRTGGICPTEDYVKDLLKSCGKKLGIDYVAR